MALNEHLHIQRKRTCILGRRARGQGLTWEERVQSCCWRGRWWSNQGPAGLAPLADICAQRTRKRGYRGSCGIKGPDMVLRLHWLDSCDGGWYAVCATSSLLRGVWYWRRRCMRGDKAQYAIWSQDQLLPGLSNGKVYELSVFGFGLKALSWAIQDLGKP